MQDKRKFRLLVGVGVVTSALIFIGLILLVVHFMNAEPPALEVPNQIQSSQAESQETRTEESSRVALVDGSSSSKDETVQTTESSRPPVREVDEVSNIRNFLSVYFTWELQEDSVTERAELLQELMTEKLYDEKEIEADSEVLKELIDTFNETNEINTSNSMQLLSSRYLSSQIYQDTNDETLYRVTVRIAKQAPYQDAPFMIEEAYHLRFEDNHVTNLDGPKDQLRSGTNDSE
ncbi:conserved domain protein (plasmid) [Enterococcus mundtii QU 25]|uniref:hypothetical protein n=1 Tax=Enterococcus mundtii TaxID=53346 RepID=UPI0003C53E3B|nr:hypothetical protein [Enterococcus mundtii]BAO08510.1 conserved domain protein [Enterococcus mundtii QU 25]